MDQYKFKYTKPKQSFMILSICIALYVIIIFIGIHFSFPENITIFAGLIIVIILFRFTRKFALSPCTAKLQDSFVEFNFKEISKTVNFANIISFKAYYGLNATVLYLKSNDENFKISANSNYGRIDDFNNFCKAIIQRLEKYKT